MFCYTKLFHCSTMTNELIVVTMQKPGDIGSELVCIVLSLINYRPCYYKECHTLLTFGVEHVCTCGVDGQCLQLIV